MTDVRNTKVFPKVTYGKLLSLLLANSRRASELIEEFLENEYNNLTLLQKEEINKNILDYDKRNFANGAVFQCNAIRLYRLFMACPSQNEWWLDNYTQYLLPSETEKFQHLLNCNKDYHKLLKQLSSKSSPSNLLIERFYTHDYRGITQEQQENINTRVLEYDRNNLKKGMSFKCNALRFYRLFSACPDQQDLLYKNRFDYLLPTDIEQFQDLVLADIQSGKSVTYHMLLQLFASHSAPSSTMIERFYIDEYHNIPLSQQENIDAIILEYDIENLNAHHSFKCHAQRFYRLFNACPNQQEELFKHRSLYLDQLAANEFEDLLVADLRKESGIVPEESQAEKDANKLKNENQFSQDPVRNFHAIRLLFEQEEIKYWHVLVFYKKFYPELSREDKKLCNAYIAKKLRVRNPGYCQEFLTIAQDQKAKSESSTLSYFVKQSSSMPTGWKWLERAGIILGVAIIVAAILFPPVLAVAIPLLGKLIIGTGAFITAISALSHVSDIRSSTIPFTGKSDIKQDLDNLAYPSTTGHVSGILPLRETKAPKTGMDQKEIQARLHHSQIQRQELQASESKWTPLPRKPKCAYSKRPASIASPAEGPREHKKLGLHSKYTPGLHKPKVPVPELTAVPEFIDISDQVECYHILNISKT